MPLKLLSQNTSLVYDLILDSEQIGTLTTTKIPARQRYDLYGTKQGSDSSPRGDHHCHNDERDVYEGCFRIEFIHRFKRLKTL
ncbi:MAG: hypothetical protein MUO53_13940 [Maribacter sp.]|nr:hypothetical protein [Maribacter sp.]